MRRIRGPYLLYLGDAGREFGAKTAQGVLYWRPELCVGQFRLQGCEIDLGLNDLDFAEAFAVGARTVVLGVAARGGLLPESWIPSLEQALEAGLDIASGLHHRLTAVQSLNRLSNSRGRVLHDVRHWPGGEMPLATGARRSGRRVLVVGTDCAVGKKFTALALHQELKNRAIAATFRATGQTGIIISGSGVALDAIPGDFIAGVAESISPANEREHWDVIEGQASVLHPTFAAVTTGLLHGSQPDALVLCHEVGRKNVRGLPNLKLPSVKRTLEAHIASARLTNVNSKGIAVSLNTSQLGNDEARDAIKQVADELELPTTDPVRFGAGLLADAVEAIS